MQSWFDFTANVAVYKTRQMGRCGMNKTILIRATYIFLILLLLGVWSVQVSNYHSAIESTEVWARAAPIESCDSKPEVESSGSMFTRTFIVAFSCEKTILEQWVIDSPSLRETNFTISNDSNRYVVTPGGGAAYAEVNINWTDNTVLIRVSWS